MRFENIKNRKFATVISQFSFAYINQYITTIKHAKWKNHKWKGLSLMKDPMTLSVYMMILQELKPKTILEFGTYDGGSALWMEDILKSLMHECNIHTFDINSERVQIPENSEITYHQLDNYKIKEFIDQNKELFKDMKSPILMIEDSHKNAPELIKLIDPYLRSGDYLIIEDTIREKKYNETVNSESIVNSKTYEVDTFYCDFWGFNNSWNINSILRKK